MKYCSCCKVSVTGQTTLCPLCQSELTGEGTPAVFPIILKSRSRTLLLRLLVFLSIAAALVCVFINLMYPTNVFWAFFVVAGVACLWLSVSVAIRKRRDLLKNISWQAFILSVLSIAWDYFTRWRGWSINFVVPSIFLITMLLTPLLTKLLHLPQSAYLVYFGLVIGFGLVPAAFLFAGLITIPLPSVLSVCVSLVSLIALCVFGGRAMLEELRRRFHL